MDNIERCIEKEKLPRFDIYLAGNWQEDFYTPYKRYIKEAFPEEVIYDPEDFEDDKWFGRDLNVLDNTKCLICYANDLPMSSCSFEMGYFYNKILEDKKNGLPETRRIIIIWEEGVKPKYSVRWYKHFAHIVDDVNDAIELYEQIYL